MARLRGLVTIWMVASTVALVAASSALADGITNSGDDLRTGWYPNAQITPGTVTGGTFGQEWSVAVDGQVYAQPLATTDANGNERLIVATETNHVYGLDPQNGGQQIWSHDLGTPWNPADDYCADISPSIGTTATPVIDTATQTVYLTHKTYVSGTSGPAIWYMDAFDVGTGQERPGFPVVLSGTADNNPKETFNAKNEQQRPGLLLMGGVIYAAFGGHCDAAPWEGWVFGVDAYTPGQATGGNITARWVDSVGDGAGIWQSGVGLMSDRPGSLLFVTGNGDSPANVPTPGNQPPATFGESVVRLGVNPNGSLSPADFFTPSDPQALDQYDADFGAGGIVGLPSAEFGTAADPHLAVAVGKQGYVYLLNLDNLGGLDEGSGGGDAVIQRLGYRGGVWGRSGVWPGDGGYVYITTATGMSGGGPLDVYKYGVNGSGAPSLTLAGSSQNGSSPNAFGWGSGSPVITSTGTSSNTALVWVIWSTDRSGANGQLRAYEPVPVNGVPQLVYSAPLGTVTNYSMPGVGNDGRLYIGTRDGHVLAFGAPVQPALSAPPPTFAPTTTGQSDTETVTFTAGRAVTVTGLSLTSDQFTIGTPSQSLPAALQAGDTLTVPVTFSPTETGPLSGELDAATSQGEIRVPLTANGVAPDPQLTVSPPLLSMGGTAIGGHLDGTITLANTGNATLHIQSVSAPAAPFSISGLSVGDTIPAGQSIGVQVSFDPGSAASDAHSYTDELDIGSDSSDGPEAVGLQASATLPGQLVISSPNVEFGNVALGSTSTGTFTLTNAGGTTVTIDKSKPPFGGAFSATTTLPEGYQLVPGAQVPESVTFAPTATGEADGVWQITGNDPSGPQQVAFTGYGFDPNAAPPASGGGTPPGSGVTVTPSQPTPAPAPTPTSTSTPSSTPSPAPHSALAAPVLGARTIWLRHISAVHIRYTAPARGVTQLTLLRLVGGRRDGARCLAVTTPHPRGARCTLTEVVAVLAHHDRAGAVRLPFTALISPRRLTPGGYLLRCTLHDAAGRPRTFTVRLRIR